jgi:uncharacterized protein
MKSDENITMNTTDTIANTNTDGTMAKNDALTQDFLRQVDTACAEACRMIAPAWPLDQSIAVNPHWSRVALPLRRVAARMAVLGEIQVFPPRAMQDDAFQQGRISMADLHYAIGQIPAARASGLTPQQCVQGIKHAPAITRLPLLIDLLDADPLREHRLSWRQAITHQVSQTCAAYFDAHQADWHPDRQHGLYTFWRDTLQHDHGISVLMGLPRLGRALNALPPTREDAERWVLQRLGLPPDVWADYLESVLLTVNGWASWCAYLGWQARLQGNEDGHLRDLLAIRLAWGAILLECKGDGAELPALVALQNAWQRANDVIADAEKTLLLDEVWQVALEAGYQRRLVQQLSGAGGELGASDAVDVQAAFCIDVRSEPQRRALEAVWPAIQTIGFAGFFGLPVAYTPLATDARRPQLPGLLAPTAEVVDRIAASNGETIRDEANLQRAAALARSDRFALATQWRANSQWPTAAFSFVEAAGVGYAGKLWQWLRPSQNARVNDDLAGLPPKYRAVCRPQLAGMDVSARVALAAGVLHAMGLDRKLAPLVLLVGHGSQSSNNAHAASLDCGACCGQTGEVNARALAQLLNESIVRNGLISRGITVPADTWFMAALHNTTTDEIEAFDVDLLPPAALARWRKLQPIWAQASDQVRRERAPSLGLDPRAPFEKLLSLLRTRANDGAQTRPEWGLAQNASFLIAPRARSRSVVLAGRSFLHDYDAAQDTDGSVLELLMTAPMLVTHWINWQYHASTCDPLRLGSGNKVLHNVVGGNIGVFEGNGGDLRIGLSRQSLHDGERWMHEPLRLTVVIDAPQKAINAVIDKHAVLQQLLNNGWLHLWRLDQTEMQRYTAGEWQPLEADYFGATGGAATARISTPSLVELHDAALA